MDIVSYHNKDEEPASVGPPSSRTKVRRVAHRAAYDRASVLAILEAGFVCHVGWTSEQGPMVIPTGYAVMGERLYLHGSASSEMIRTLAAGAPACVTVTHVDGVVCGRSLLHHSFNYRSVVVFGEATEVRDRDEKFAALNSFTDHILPGRSTEARPANDRELRRTGVVWLPIDEASAKVAVGFREDETSDLDLPVWNGLVPLHVVAGEPRTSPTSPAGVPVPASVEAFALRHPHPNTDSLERFASYDSAKRSKNRGGG